MTAHARRLIDGQLFFDGDVQPEVQKRIGFAVSRKIIAFPGGFRLFEKSMVFRVAQDNLHNQLFNSFERTSFSVGSPGAKENFARLPAIVPDQHVRRGRP